MFAMADDKDEEGGFAAQKITIGVCVMEKKVKCGYEVLLFFFFTPDPVFFFACWFCFLRESRETCNELRERVDSVALFCIAAFFGAYGADSSEVASVW